MEILETYQVNGASMSQRRKWSLPSKGALNQETVHERHVGVDGWTALHKAAFRGKAKRVKVAARLLEVPVSDSVEYRTCLLKTQISRQERAYTTGLHFTWQQRPERLKS